MHFHLESVLTILQLNKDPGLIILSMGIIKYMNAKTEENNSELKNRIILYEILIIHLI